MTINSTNHPFSFFIYNSFLIENAAAIKGKTFVEYIYLDLNFEFIWFAQKSNNELLFFYENESVFTITVYDISKFQVIKRNSIKQI